MTTHDHTRIDPLSTQTKLQAALDLLRGDPLLWPLTQELRTWLRLSTSALIRRCALRYLNRAQPPTESMLRYLHAVYPYLVDTAQCRAQRAFYAKSAPLRLDDPALEHCDCVRHRLYRLLRANGYGV